MNIPRVSRNIEIQHRNGNGVQASDFLDQSFQWGIHTTRIWFALPRNEPNRHRSQHCLTFDSGYNARLWFHKDYAYCEFNPARVADPDDWRAASLPNSLWAIQQVRQQVKEYLPWACTFGDIGISRLDLTRDFNLPGGLTQEPRRPRRAKKSNNYTSANGAVSGLDARYGPHHGSIVFYDKYQELTDQRSKVEAKDIWRFEVQARRGMLRDAGIRQVRDLTVDRCEWLLRKRFEQSRLGDWAPRDDVLRAIEDKPVLVKAMISAFVPIAHGEGMNKRIGPHAFEQRLRSSLPHGQERLDLERGIRIMLKTKLKRSIRCSHQDCVGKIHAVGLCNTHYKAMLRGSQETQTSDPGRVPHSGQKFQASAIRSLQPSQRR